MILVRQEIGDVLRDFRLQKGRTLRQVASKASVALGYLSEVERGQKEASSEILASVADALDTPISVIMREVGDRLSVLESIQAGVSPVATVPVVAERAPRVQRISTPAFTSGSSFPDVLPDDFAAGFDADLVAR